MGGWSCTVALGKVGVLAGAPGGLSGEVGDAGLSGAAEVASLMVGAGAVAAAAGRSGTVGAADGGRGAPAGTGGRTGGASGTVADGTAGASAALRVTRTVSFLRGTLEVCLDGVGGWFSFSLMRARGLGLRTARVRQLGPLLSNGDFHAFFDVLRCRDSHGSSRSERIGNARHVRQCFS